MFLCCLWFCLLWFWFCWCCFASGCVVVGLRFASALVWCGFALVLGWFGLGISSPMSSQELPRNSDPKPWNAKPIPIGRGLGMGFGMGFGRGFASRSVSHSIHLHQIINFLRFQLMPKTNPETHPSWEGIGVGLGRGFADPAPPHHCALFHQ